MWLLDTHTLKLHLFLYPQTVKEGYLILSHVWDNEEQSFQDIQRIHERCNATGEDPHDLVSPKIRKTCEVAERHGYQWAWIDTCCIDKTSSAELSETINAMFQYYALALVCYVYLGDMKPIDRAFLKEDLSDPHVAKSDRFSVSRWHKRGWTLQELIAPKVVHFFARNWEPMGNKEELADGLELLTGIPATVLRFQQTPAEFSVAQRMSWAAKRETRRIEDEAYCLLGLFDVSMPTLYGEGKRAFERLQEAILARTPDTTLFAWGRSVKLHDLDDRRTYSRAGMLATSPSDYGSCSAIRFAPRSRISEGSRRERKPMQFVFNITPHGILARIPLLRANGHMLADLSWSEGDDPLFLVLRMRAPRYINTLPLYDVGVYLPPRNRWDVSPTRLSYSCIKDHPDSGSSSNCAPSIPTWKLLYLQTRSYREPEPRVYLPLNHTCPPIFRLPEHHITHFLRYEKGWRIHHAQLPWLGTPPLMITFPYEAVHDSLYVAIQFGCCDAGNRTSTGSVDLASIWANFRGSTSTADCGDQDHECPTDHILTWPDLERTFVLLTHHVLGSPIGERDMKWMLKMSFTQTPVGTGSLTLTHISITNRTLMKLAGYRDLIEEAEAEEQEELNARAAALLIKDSREQEQVKPCTMGPGALSGMQVDYRDADDSRVSRVKKRRQLSLARRTFCFLIWVMDESIVLPNVFLWPADWLSPCLDPHLYDMRNMYHGAGAYT